MHSRLYYFGRIASNNISSRSIQTCNYTLTTNDAIITDIAAFHYIRTIPNPNPIANDSVSCRIHSLTARIKNRMHITVAQDNFGREHAIFSYCNSTTVIAHSKEHLHHICILAYFYCVVFVFQFNTPTLTEYRVSTNNQLVSCSTYLYFHISNFYPPIIII